MTTSFEFLPRSERRIRMGWKSPTLLFGIALQFVVLWVFLSGSMKSLQASYEQRSREVTARQSELIAEARTMLPDPTIVTDLGRRLQAHNEALIGPRTPWTKIFRMLEAILPTDSVVTALLDPDTGSPAIPGGARRFRLTILVGSLEAANQLYLKLSSLTSIDELSFQPKGETTYQGRKGTTIELGFRFLEPS